MKNRNTPISCRRRKKKNNMNESQIVPFFYPMEKNNPVSIVIPVLSIVWKLLHTTT